MCVGRGDVSLVSSRDDVRRAERGDVSLACIAQGMTYGPGGEMYPW